VAVEALYDASQEDVATGGPNLLRGIFPTVRTITTEGVVRISDEEVRAAFEAIVDTTHETQRREGGSGAREADEEGRS
jgi:proteasome beta subunit